MEVYPLQATISRELKALSPDVRRKIEDARARLNRFIALGLIKTEEIVGRTIYDWECGDGSFAVALFLEGADQVIGTDTWLNEDKVNRDYAQFRPLIKFFRTSVFNLKEHVTARMADAAFTCNVTEHVPRLESQLEAVAEFLKPGAPFVISHHNYLHAIGHHDFMFLETSRNGIRVRAPKCWETAEKCETSSDFRKREAAARPWMWNAAIEKKLSPDKCGECPYYRRARPWAHLVNSDYFSDIYPRGFSSGKNGSTLNKITTFQLRQALIEAGFSIEFDQRDTSSTKPPGMLLNSGFFSELDLTTFMFRLRCIRRNDSSGRLSGD
jgi:2-polyprenyl-3-methyl-5-hydroxy-6-metoxy-1,4-benzoquinol methylase